MKADPDYFVTLDGMRGLAALSVVMLHGLDAFGLDRPLLPHAGLAVDFFFMLSGFVIAHSYDSKLLGGMSLGAFFKVRVIRLYPLVALGLLFGLVVMVLKLVLQHQPGLWGATLASFALNAVLLPSPFLVATEHGTAWPINLPLWSLAYEALINAVYAVVLVRLATRPLLLLMLACAGLMAWRIAHGHGMGGGVRWDDLAPGLLRVAYPFMAGLLLSRLWRHASRMPTSTSPSIASPRWLKGWHAGWPAAVLLMLFCLPVDPTWSAVLEGVVVWLVFPVLIWVGAHGRTGGLQPALLWLGALSYPVYVLHYPLIKIFSFVARRLGLDQAPWAYAIVAVELVLSVALATMALRYFDEPVRQWLRQRRGVAITGSKLA